MRHDDDFFANAIAPAAKNWKQICVSDMDLSDATLIACCSENLEKLSVFNLRPFSFDVVDHIANCCLNLIHLEIPDCIVHDEVLVNLCVKLGKLSVLNLSR